MGKFCTAQGLKPGLVLCLCGMTESHAHPRALIQTLVP